MSEKEIIYKEELDNAIASVEFEGYRVTDEQKSQCFDFLSGKIDKDTFIQMILKGCNAYRNIYSIKQPHGIFSLREGAFYFVRLSTPY